MSYNRQTKEQIMEDYYKNIQQLNVKQSQLDTKKWKLEQRYEGVWDMRNDINTMISDNLQCTVGAGAEELRNIEQRIRDEYSRLQQEHESELAQIYSEKRHLSQLRE